jgi:ubiquinone/menaquinone biosynthesis C-methylase UbiE
MTDDGKYIYALRFRWLNAIYDPIVRVTTREQLVKKRLVAEIPRTAGDLLDLASGSGTLTREIKASFSKCSVTGIDGDEDMLGRAQGLAKKAGLAVTYDHALAQELPYPESTFDVVTSSLFFHHLKTRNKKLAFAEANRVLKPGGTLLIADWGKPQSWLMRVKFLLVQILDGFETTADNVRGLIPSFIRGAGFTDVSVLQNFSTSLGTITLIKASKEGDTPVYSDARGLAASNQLSRSS